MAPENPLGRRRRGGRVRAGLGDAASEPLPPPAPTACPPPPCAPAPPPSPAARRRERRAGARRAPRRPLPVPPPAVPRGNIVGTVTTKPAALQAQAVVYLEDGPKEDAPVAPADGDDRQPADELHPVRLGRRAWAARSSSPTRTRSRTTSSRPTTRSSTWATSRRTARTCASFKNAGRLLAALQPAPRDARLPARHALDAGTRGPTPRGSSSMKHVPSGTYKVTAWAPRQAPVTQSRHRRRRRRDRQLRSPPLKGDTTCARVIAVRRARSLSLSPPAAARATQTTTTRRRHDARRRRRRPTRRRAAARARARGAAEARAARRAPDRERGEHDDVRQDRAHRARRRRGAPHLQEQRDDDARCRTTGSS